MKILSKFLVVFFSALSIEGVAFSDLQVDPLKEVAARSKSAPVPQRVQIGPTCGLYALGMVMDYWHERDQKNPTVLVSDIDLKGRGAQYNFDSTSNERILPYVQSTGYTLEGEMFSAQYLANTAVHFGYQATLYPSVTLEDLYTALDQKHPVIVALDVDWTGNPSLLQGKRAHYAVIEGYFDYEGSRYVVARHGWGGEIDYVWKADDLFASMVNLMFTDYYLSVSSEPASLHLPAYQGNNQLETISESLRDKMIEVVPVGEIPAGGIPAVSQ